MKIIETERLYLRELLIVDKKELMKVLSNPESMEFYPNPFSEQEVEKWIQWNIDNYKKYKHGLWAVILKDGEVFIGNCGITMQNIGNGTVRRLVFILLRNIVIRDLQRRLLLPVRNMHLEYYIIPKYFHIPQYGIFLHKKLPRRLV